MKVCNAEDCDRKQKARGWCMKHYMRWRKHGDVTVVGVGGNPMHGSHSGTPVGYMGAHRRVSRLYGAASDHQCVGCEGNAEDWAYDHLDPDELHQDIQLRGYVVPYSLNPGHYRAMCRECHWAFDRDTAGAQ